MAYDHALAERIRALLVDEPGVTERAMFGGLAFLCDGRMAVCAANRGGLLVRVDRERTEELTARAHVAAFVMRGRPVAGWLRVGAEALDDDAMLRDWVALGVNHAQDEAAADGAASA